MSTSDVNMTEEELLIRLTETHYLGEASGLEMAANDLRNHAAQLFLHGSEEQARFLKTCAAELAKQASTLRDKWAPIPRANRAAR